VRNLTGDLHNARKVTAGSTFRLQAEIYNDSRGRFADGEVVLTSPVIEQEGSIFITEHSAYDVKFWAPGETP
jgi:hypothetical protein